MSYERPHETTCNPGWREASEPLDLIPTTDDDNGLGAEMLHFVGAFLMTQGARSGERFGEVWEPWQRELIRYVFGATTPEGRRLVRKMFLKIGKGSGKSTMVAAIALGVVMHSAHHGKHTRGLVSIIAAGISSADIVFSHILEAVLNDPHLREQFKSSTQRRSITHVETGIEIQTTVPKPDAAVGRRPFLVICDEKHEAARLKDFSKTYDQLIKGGANWGDSFLAITITTAPMGPAAMPYAVDLQEARGVRDGTINNDGTAAFLFEVPMDQELDLSDSDNWWWGLPTLGATLPVDAIANEFEDAQNAIHTEPMSLFLSQRLGVEPEERLAVEGLLLQAAWDTLPECWELPGQGPLWVAYDPGGADDLMAVAMLWEDEYNVLCLRVEQHLMQIGYDRAPDSLKVLYDKAIAAGELHIHPSGNVMDAQVMAHAQRLHGAYRGDIAFGGDAFGRAGFVAMFRQKVSDEFHTVPQGWQLQACLNDLEMRAADSKLAHQHRPLFTANVHNVRLEDGPSGRRFSKQDAGASGQGLAKIDGLMAALSAVKLWADHPMEAWDVAAWVG
jgi:phage terminase large subunit-like protein